MEVAAALVRQCGFDKSHRLSGAGEFDFVFKKPSRSFSKSFTILARPNQCAYPRLGLVISKRCAKQAVRRNRLKRIIRESFRQSQKALAGLDVVVIGKTAATSKNNKQLFSLLAHQWSELGQCGES